jgi:hypothetical protein
VYKILYLPLGEELLISCHYMGPYIPDGLRPWESSISLKAPGTPTKGSQFKKAIFTTKPTAMTWITDLIERGSTQSLGLRLEHFEIVDNNRD